MLFCFVMKWPEWLCSSFLPFMALHPPSNLSCQMMWIFLLGYDSFPFISWSDSRPLICYHSNWDGGDWPLNDLLDNPFTTYIVQVKITGYAASGGGRGIERVDVSVDGGKTWIEAFRYQRTGIPYISEHTSSEKWAWVLFEATADVQQSTEIVAKAVCLVCSDDRLFTTMRFCQLGSSYWPLIASPESLGCIPSKIAHIRNYIKSLQGWQSLVSNILCSIQTNGSPGLSTSPFLGTITNQRVWPVWSVVGLSAQRPFPLWGPYFQLKTTNI